MVTKPHSCLLKTEELAFCQIFYDNLLEALNFGLPHKIPLMGMAIHLKFSDPVPTGIPLSK